jgi:hypothetical protein
MKKIVISLLYLLVLFFISRFIFEPTYLYYELKWLDIPMHVLGGFGVASLAHAILSYLKKPVSFWSIVVSYTAIAVAWELYEYSRDVMTGNTWNGWLDTIADYVNGGIGAFIAHRFLTKK